MPENTSVPLIAVTPDLRGIAAEQAAAPTTAVEATATEEAAPPADDVDSLPEWARKAISKANNDAANYRTKLREAEPIVKAHQEAEERNKTEIQRANERAEQLAQQLAVKERELIATRHGIPESDFDLLGSGTSEEMESRAARLASYRTTAPPVSAPPTNRPVEALRPGASPLPPPPEDNSYPAAWGFQPQRAT